MFSNLILVYVNQSQREQTLNSLLHSKDKVIWYINIIILMVMVICIYTPYGNSALQIQQLTLFQVTIAILLSVCSTGWWDIVKYVNKSKK